MADNVEADAGSGGATFATDDISSVHYPRNKIVIGADGVNDGDISAANPMPVKGTGTAGTANSGVVTVQGIASMTAVQIADNGGSITVDNGGTFAVQAVCTNAGTFAVQVDGAALTALQLLDDVVATDGSAALTKGNQICGTDGTNAQIVSVTTGGHVHIHDGGNTITVDGTVAISGTVTVDGSGVTQPISHAALTELAAAIDTEVQCDIVGALPAGTNAIGKLAANSGVDIGDVDVTSITPGTAASSLGKAEDAGHSTGDVGVMALSVRQDTAAALSGTDADYQPLITDSSGRLHVNVGNTVTVGSHAVTNAGTFAVQAASAGDVSHDSADSGNPVKIGAKAETSPKGITLVADADRTDLLADQDGMLMVKLYTSGADQISERVSNTDGASTAFSTFDNTAGTRNYITSVTIHNSHSTTNGYVDFRDGTAGSILWTFPAPANGGVTHNFSPPLRQPTAATALAFDASAAISTIYISVAGFKSKV